MKYLFLALLLTCATRPALAQTTTLAPAGPAVAPAPTAAQVQAATALLNTIYTEDSFNQLIEQSLQAQAQANPAMKAYLPEMRTFLRKYLSLSALRPQMAELYAREFSLDELQELTRFYQSPVGRKASEKLPMLMRSGMEIGQRAVQNHMDELKKTLEAKAKTEHSEH